MAGKKTGRPKKVPTEEIIGIINRYQVEMSDVGFSFFSHGVYKKLSDYAKSLGFPLEPHDFSRNKDVMAHIKKLDATSASTHKDTLSMPAFEPLDIPTLMNFSKKRIEESIRSRDAYFEALHLKAARAIENYSVLAKKVEHLQVEIKSLTKQNVSLSVEKDDLKAQLRDAKTDIAYLTRIIRKNVEPELAQQFFQSLNNKTQLNQIASRAVTSTLMELSREDRQTRAEAEQEVASLSLLSLLGEN